MNDKQTQPEGASHEPEVVELDYVRLLTEITSHSFRISNTTWLALVTISVIVIASRDSQTAITLPFDLGAVSPASFFVVTLAMLIAATLAFAGAHAQAYRAYDLTMKAIGAVGLNAVVRGTSIHPRDFVDLLHYPTINRVGPIAQLARGPHQFRRELDKVPAWRRHLAEAYYVVLKLTAFCFYFGIPCYALWIAFRSAPLSGSGRVVAVCGVLVSSVAMLQIMFRESLQIARVTMVSLGARPRGEGLSS